MNFEILESPFRCELIGVSGSIDGKYIGTRGRELMDQMWKEVKARGIPNRGQNHWVYLANDRMFTGVEPETAGDNIGNLERLTVEIPRYLRYVHVGPYTQLPQVWEKLMQCVTDAGEAPEFPNLEIYGHWTSDESKLETTILIALQGRP